jgi:hypothetical protein
VGHSALAGNGRNSGVEQEIVGENTSADTAPRGISWDFGKIPLFPPERASRVQPSFAPAATPIRGAVQAKLVVGQANDPLEQEADRVADRVMRMADPDLPTMDGSPQVSRKCAACEAEEEEKLQKKEAASKDEIILRQEESPYYQLDQPAVGDFYFCNPPSFDRDQIVRALDNAKLWVTSAILNLELFALGGQTIEEETVVRLALRDNFNLTETHPPETLVPKSSLKTIIDNFVTINGALNQTLNFFCAPDCRPGELAWVLPHPEKLGVPPATITTCQLFFGCDPLKQASTIIHERAHQAIGAQDRAYEVDSRYDSLPTNRALDNADSYAVAARQIFHGGIFGPGLSCAGTSRSRPFELLEPTPQPPRAPRPPRNPPGLGGKLTPPAP